MPAPFLENFLDPLLLPRGSLQRDARWVVSYFLMIIADLAQITGRTYPARRRTQNLVGGVSPIQATNFSIGNVTLEPNGGQVPWHNQQQEEQPLRNDQDTRVEISHAGVTLNESDVP